MCLDMITKKKYLGRYSFHIDKEKKSSGYILAVDRKKKEVVGHIEYYQPCSYLYPTIEYSFILRKHRGIGLGFQMYNAAIKHFGGIRSDDQLTADSSSLWKKLIREGNVFMEESSDKLLPVYWDSEEDKPEVPDYDFNLFNNFSHLVAFRCRKSKAVY